MKTIKEWFELIEDDEIKSKALINLNVNNYNIKKSSLSSAIHAAFTWANTVEGHNYWDRIYRNPPKLRLNKVVIYNKVVI